jgi:hypothetical protein
MYSSAMVAGVGDDPKRSCQAASGIGLLLQAAVCGALPLPPLAPPLPWVKQAMKLWLTVPLLLPLLWVQLPLLLLLLLLLLARLQGFKLVS